MKSPDRQFASHESFEREEAVRLPAARSFGITIAAVFFLIFVAPGIWAGEWRWWALIVSVVFVLAALAFPAALSRLNYLWYRVGLLLHGVVNPIVLGIIFAFIILIGWVWRTFTKDPLRLKFDSAAKSYWIERKPPGPNTNDFPHQF